MVWPDDTSMKSQPAALKARAIATASSSVLPPGAQSCAEMRTLIGRSAGQAARIAREHLERVAAARLAMSPPYSSLRRLVSGLRKDASR